MRVLKLCGILILAAVLVLEPGMVSPAWADTTYTVQPGDTLWGIATRFGTTVSAIVQANGIRDQDYIWVGQKLTIPGASEGETRAPERSSSAATTTSPRPRSAPYAGPGSILANRRLVTYYGNPYAGAMGVLGRYDPDTVVAKLRQQTLEYAALSDKPVQPTLHMVATVAQAGPGSDGMYRLRMPASVIEEWAQIAERYGLLLILDLQVGRSTVEAEVNAMRRFLERPYVHLALDPEFDMGPGKIPGQHIGSTDAAQINWAADTLSDIVAQNGLPNKILFVHQFLESMITNKTAIRTNPRVDIVINADGFGGQAAKISKYDFVQSVPVQFAGIKLFYREDTDLLSPAQVMALEPKPDVIVYQ